MKKVFSLIIFLVIGINLYSQNMSQMTASRDYYLQKSKKQNATGWILLGTGTTMTVVGAIGFGNNFMSAENGTLKGGNAQKADTYGYIILAGLAMDIASIPVFISASRNKKRAATMEISNQVILQPHNNLTAMRRESIPSLTLKINF